MQCLITGAAGVIGSNLADRWLQADHTVTGFDSFPTGREPYSQNAVSSPRFRLIRRNLLDLSAVQEAAAGVDIVSHLPNADDRFDADHPGRDLDQNTVATWNVLESAANRESILNPFDADCRVNRSLSWICQHVVLESQLSYSGGDRGWTDDNPFIRPACSRMRALGWSPRFSIRKPVVRTLEYRQSERWLLEER